MKKTLYVIKKLGFWKSTAYLILYPLRFLRKSLHKLDDIHDEIRWHISLYSFIEKSGKITLPVLSSDLKKKIEHKFSPFQQKINEDWFRFYVFKNGKESSDFIPDNILFRVIIPALNNMRLLSYYEDKNHYDDIMGGFLQPKTLLRYIRGRFYDEYYSLIEKNEVYSKLNGYEEHWVIKPTNETGGGRNIYYGNAESRKIYLNSKPHTLSALTNLYKHGFIIQERINQTDILAAFHPHSLNTFRIITLRLNNKIHSLSAIVKFGTKGIMTDNSGDRGVWVGVTDDGYMKKYGFSHTKGRIEKHPDSCLSFEGVHLTFFEKAVDFAKNMHHRLIHFDLVSWDIAINTNNNPVFIEYNLIFQGTINSQIANGPLFGELTNDVFTEVAKRSNSIPV
jgi:hypothetical protein